MRASQAKTMATRFYNGSENNKLASQITSAAMAGNLDVMIPLPVNVQKTVRVLTDLGYTVSWDECWMTISWDSAK